MGKYPVLPITFGLMGLGSGLLLVSGVLPESAVHSRLSHLFTLPHSPLALGFGWLLLVGYFAMLFFIGIKLARGTWKPFCARLASRFTAE